MVGYVDLIVVRTYADIMIIRTAKHSANASTANMTFKNIR